MLWRCTTTALLITTCTGDLLKPGTKDRTVEDAFVGSIQTSVAHRGKFERRQLHASEGSACAHPTSTHTSAPTVAPDGDEQTTPCFVHETDDSTLDDPDSALLSSVWRALSTFHQLSFMGTLSYLNNKGSSIMFPYNNFVQGFHQPGLVAWITRKWDCGWLGDAQKCERHTEGVYFHPPIANESIGVVSFNEYSLRAFGKEFPYAFFDRYYTGNGVPSWEDNDNHQNGMAVLDSGVYMASKLIDGKPMSTITGEQRFEFDEEALTRLGWSGFPYMTAKEIKYASNGANGVDVLRGLHERYASNDTLALLMQDSVFSAHLTYDNKTGDFRLDLSMYEKYVPLDGMSPMGGQAVFRFVPAAHGGGRLVTKELTYGGETFPGPDWGKWLIESADAAEEASFAASAASAGAAAWDESRLVGWRKAEKCIIASLMGVTNLVVHVKDLHLELAAAFQAVTIDSFAARVKHPVRRMLDPYIHRAVQSTNDNFKLLFEYQAAEWSLAPLNYTEQLRLMDDAIRERPLFLRSLDMDVYASERGMDPAFSTSGQSASGTDNKTWQWRWHYRALTVQRLYEDLVTCHLDRNNLTDKAIGDDTTLQKWWADMREYMPAVNRSIGLPDHAGDAIWAEELLDRKTLVNVAKTLMVWLSWVHEDVGHSAAAYVYNPVHVPMQVPVDGVGIPLRPYLFNTAAYRGFVFLERAQLLHDPPEFWFDNDSDDKKCFIAFQDALRKLGSQDPAFSECDATGFYSCVDRVETGVSS